MTGAESGSEGMTLAQLAEALGGTVEGDAEIRIQGVAGLDDAAPGTIVRVEQPRYLRAALQTPAAALLAPPGFDCAGRACLRVADVRSAFVRCLELFDRENPPAPGRHPTAVVAEDAVIGEGCSIGPYAVIGAGARLGAGTVVHAHAVVGEHVETGEGCVLFPHVTLYPRTVLGSRVRIHAGAVIGADGYGYEWLEGRHRKRPHNGRVRIGDEVEIGANTAIDRATTGETVIGPGTKIDNLVQVAHNVTTGAHCLLVSQVGVAGSARLGNGVVLGGQCGVAPHAVLEDGVRGGGRAGFWSSEPAGRTCSGNPARPHAENLKIQAALGKLPELLKRVRELEHRLAELEGGD